MFRADAHSPRLQVRRVELVETDDTGEMQMATVRGYADEMIKLGHRVQPFGTSGHVPPGAHGLALLVNGRPDQSVLLGLEHPDHRPRGQAVGEKAIYNAHGDIISLVQRKIRVVTQTFEVVAPSIKLTGTITIEGDIGQQGSITSTGDHIAASHA